MIVIPFHPGRVLSKLQISWNIRSFPQKCVARDRASDLPDVRPMPSPLRYRRSYSLHAKIWDYEVKQIFLAKLIKDSKLVNISIIFTKISSKKALSGCIFKIIIADPSWLVPMYVYSRVSNWCHFAFFPIFVAIYNFWQTIIFESI